MEIQWYLHCQFSLQGAVKSIFTLQYRQIGLQKSDYFLIVKLWKTSVQRMKIWPETDYGTNHKLHPRNTVNNIHIVIKETSKTNYRHWTHFIDDQKNCRWNSKSSNRNPIKCSKIERANVNVFRKGQGTRWWDGCMDNWKNQGISEGQYVKLWH